MKKENILENKSKNIHMFTCYQMGQNSIFIITIVHWGINNKIYSKFKWIVGR